MDRENGEDPFSDDEEENSGPAIDLWKTQKLRIIIAILLLGILIVLVVFVNVPLMKASAGKNLAKTGWQLQSYTDATGVVVPALTDPVVTAEFMPEKGIVGGKSGCNHYSFTYNTTDYGIVISDSVRTTMFCLDPGIMAQEDAYLSDMGASTEFRVSDSSLRLYSSSGKQLLVFVPLP